MTPAAEPKRVFQRKGVRARHPVKLTALLYLKEALTDERYEECPFIIRVAQEFGAQDFEIRHLREDRRRTPA